MPIYGLTDRGMAFPEIGSIRKGAPKTDPKRPGPELPHFRVEIDAKEQSAISKFNALYGDTPDSILVILPFDEIDRVWDAWREKYVAGAMIHRCDGKNVQYSINPATGERVVVGWLRVDNGEAQPCQIKDLPKPQCCIPVGRLKVIIPALNRLAYFVVHTTSIHDIINISAQLEAIRTINGGHIAGVPLMLKRVPKEISTPSGENGKRARRIKYLISIEVDPVWGNAKFAALNMAAMPQLVAPIKIEMTRVDAGPDLAALEDFDEDEDQNIPVDGEIVEPVASIAPIDDPALCKLHGITMTAQHPETGAYYHRLEDGNYCNGSIIKPPKVAVKA